MKKIIEKINKDEILNRIKPVLSKYQAYLVGGFLRDLFFDISSFDRDIAVKNAEAKVVALELTDFLSGHFVALDEINKIYRVVLPDKMNYIDIANLAGNNLETDLGRRDLTINAIAFDLQSRNFIDLHGGIADIQNKIVRGICEKNFLDDPLRLLRIFRFRSVLGFEIDDITKKMVKKHADLVMKPSAERINFELIKLFSGSCAHLAVLEMDEAGILDRIFPVISNIKTVPPNSHHHLDLFNHSVEVVKQLQTMYESAPAQIKQYLEQPLFNTSPRLAYLKLAGLLHDAGKPDTWTIEPDTGKHRFIKHDSVGSKIAGPMLKKLKFSNRQVDLIKKLIKHHIYPSGLVCQDICSDKAKMRFFRKMDENVINSILLAKADRLCARGIDVLDEMVEKNINALEALLEYYLGIKDSIKPLPKLIDGNEIMLLLGIEPAKELGTIIKNLKEEQLSGNITTKEEAVAYLQKWPVCAQSKKSQNNQSSK